MFETLRKKKEKIKEKKDILFLLDYVKKIKSITDKYKKIGFGSETDLIYDSVVDYYMNIKSLYNSFVYDCNCKNDKIYMNNFSDNWVNFNKLDKLFFNNLSINNLEISNNLKDVFTVFVSNGTITRSQANGISDKNIYLGGDYSMIWNTYLEYDSIENWRKNKEDYKKCEKYQERIVNERNEEKYSFCKTKADFIAQYYGVNILNNIRYLNIMCDSALKTYNDLYEDKNTHKKKIK